ncbi:MAG TPA: DDE-type integrase/transposase/recombinase [Chloroflexota bacterium]|nr:DDE-type integrase/transposase/recombinase [Chloroflexota bacterium]
MVRVIQAESQLELSAIYLKEHDAAVMEYYDQPPVLKLTYEGPRHQRVLYTPDFFVIEQDGMGWEEWRPEERLLKLAAKYPHRYVRDEHGAWHFVPGERFAEPLDLFFRLRSSAEVNPTLVRNLVMLQDYLRETDRLMTEDASRLLCRIVKDQPGITLSDVLADTSADDVFGLIASGTLYVDLQAVALAEPDRVRLFPDELTAEAYQRLSVCAPDAERPRAVPLDVGTAITWDGRPWRIANVGRTCIALAAEQAEVVDVRLATFEQLVASGAIQGVPPLADSHPEVYEVLAHASARELQRANDIFDLIHSGQPAAKIPRRTLRHWKQRIRAAEVEYGRGYLGLLRKPNKGNPQPKLPNASLALMDQVIEQHYETLVQRRRRAAYGELARLCEREGVLCPSYLTFCKRAKNADRYLQTLKRRGPRAAYQAGEFVAYLDRNVARHGDRPFELAHIDHTEADIEVRHSRTGKALGRPWLTLILDAFSRRILGFHLTFDPPSYRSCMAVIRECVRRHNRLPDTIVVDGGIEFAGVYFETLLALYGVTKKTRPAAKARFGSVIERLFGTTNTQFFYNLTGNTQITKNVRQVTKEISPKALAVWTLPGLHLRLSEWAYEVYDETEHPALGQTPRDAYDQAIARTGYRGQRLIPYDDSFLFATMPSTRKGTAKVIANRGVQVNGLYYWTRAFSDPMLVGQQVPVRYEPFDVCVAFAHVRGRWERCFSQYASVFRGRSERELQLASAELRKQRQLHAQGFSVTAKRLAEFLQSAAVDEQIMTQRLRDGERSSMNASGSSTAPFRETASSGAEEMPPDQDEDAVMDAIYPVHRLPS